MSFRIKQQDIIIVSPMRFQQHHEARSDAPLKDALNDDLFLDVRSGLQVGDVVHLSHYNTKDEAAPDRELLECAQVRITFIDEASCKYFVVSHTDLTAKPAPKAAKKAA